MIGWRSIQRVVQLNERNRERPRHQKSSVNIAQVIGEFNYTPNNFPQGGQVPFTFSITDDKGRSTTSMVTMNFVGIAASDVQVAGQVGRPVTVPIRLLNINKVVNLKSLPQSGTLNATPANLKKGILTYTPNSGTTSDSFTY